MNGREKNTRPEHLNTNTLSSSGPYDDDVLVHKRDCGYNNIIYIILCVCVREETVAGGTRGIYELINI